MTIRIETRKCIKWIVDGVPGAEIELVHEPIDEREILHDIERGVVGYLVADPHLEDPMTWSDCWGRYVSCNRRSVHGVSADKFEAELAHLNEAGILWLPIECYEHGLSHYSVAHTRSYPDRRWDVRADGVFVPCEDVQARFKAGEIAMDEVIADANQAMQMYTNWANGMGWGWVVQCLDEERDSCWGYYTIEHAREALAEAFAEEVKRAMQP